MSVQPESLLIGVLKHPGESEGIKTEESEASERICPMSSTHYYNVTMSKYAIGQEEKHNFYHEA